jgi:hypothetical protein
MVLRMTVAEAPPGQPALPAILTAQQPYKCICGEQRLVFFQGVNLNLALPERPFLTGPCKSCGRNGHWEIQVASRRRVDVEITILGPPPKV